MTRLSIILIFALAVAPLPAAAQELLKLDQRYACAAEPGPLAEEATVFPSTEAASKILRDIVGYVGLSADRIDLRASNVANAVAYLDPISRRRLILYNESFVRRLQNDSGSAWVPRAILAHELAHHFNNHLEVATADRRRIEELEADRFVGHVLFKMGADLPAVTAVFAELREGGAYPPRTARIAAAENGWWIAKEQGGYPGKGSNVDTPKTTRPAPEEVKPPPAQQPPPVVQPVAEGLQLRVEQIAFSGHAGGMMGGPGLAFVLHGRLRAPAGSSVQVVVTFAFADGRGPLFPHPQENHYRGVGNVLATGSVPAPMAGDVVDLSTVRINTIPHYALNLVPTGYRTSYPIAATAHVFVNGAVVAASPAIQFLVLW